MLIIGVESENPYHFLESVQDLLVQGTEASIKRALEILTRQFGPENATSAALNLMDKISLYSRESKDGVI